jgi:hypothetical protein
MKGKKLIIILVIVAVIISIFLFRKFKKGAQVKQELNTYGGLTRDEFKAKLEKAWKDKYYKVVQDALRLPEDWAKEWRASIDESVSNDPDLDFEGALLKAAQFSYAKDNPKANDKVWSTGWISEVYVRQQLKLDPNEPAIREVILEI